MSDPRKPTRDLIKDLGLDMMGKVFGGAAHEFFDQRETLDPLYKLYPDIGVSPEIKLSPMTRDGETFYKFTGDFGDDNVKFAIQEAGKFGINVTDRKNPEGGTEYIANIKNIEDVMATVPYGTSREDPGGTVIFHFYDPNPVLKPEYRISDPK